MMLPGERDWYMTREVALRFGVHVETVRLAALAKRVPAVGIPTPKRVAWRFPKSAIDALDRWPSNRRAKRTRDDGLVGDDDVWRELGEARRELAQERTGRALAEYRITELESALDRYRSAILSLVAEDAARLAELPSPFGS